MEQKTMDNNKENQDQVKKSTKEKTQKDKQLNLTKKRTRKEMTAEDPEKIEEITDSEDDDVEMESKPTSPTAKTNSTTPPPAKKQKKGMPQHLPNHNTIDTNRKNSTRTKYKIPIKTLAVKPDANNKIKTNNTCNKTEPTPQQKAGPKSKGEEVHTLKRSNNQLQQQKETLEGKVKKYENLLKRMKKAEQDYKNEVVKKQQTAHKQLKQLKKEKEDYIQKYNAASIKVLKHDIMARENESLKTQVSQLKAIMEVPETEITGKMDVDNEETKEAMTMEQKEELQAKIKSLEEQLESLKGSFSDEITKYNGEQIKLQQEAAIATRKLNKAEMEGNTIEKKYDETKQRYRELYKTAEQQKLEVQMETQQRIKKARDEVQKMQRKMVQQEQALGNTTTIQQEQNKQQIREMLAVEPNEHLKYEELGLTIPTTITKLTEMAVTHTARLPET